MRDLIPNAVGVAPASLVAAGLVQRHDVDSVFADIRALFNKSGAEPAVHRGLSRESHSLQCAFLAERASLPPGAIVAALLHDTGTLLGAAPDDRAGVGARWVAVRFGATVAEPVRLQCDASRYLRSVDPLTSGDSAEPPLTGAQRQRLENTPGFLTALSVCRIVGEASVPCLVVPPLRSYRAVMAAVLEAR